MTSNEPIKALLCTQFEDVEGYVVSVSDPPNIMTNQFKDIGYHFLPDKGLCWRLITMTLGEYKMTGVPVHIEDSKYPRRAFVFCLCVVTDLTNRAVGLGKLVAQELADLLHQLEADSSYLSNRENDGSIRQMLASLRQDLNSESVSVVNRQVSGNHWLQFSKRIILNPGAVEERLIEPFHIPVALVDTGELSDEVACNNQLMVDVVEACNGNDSCSEISHFLGIGFPDLTRVLSALQRKGMVYVLDQPIDKYSRIRLTKNFHAFFDDLSNRQEAIAFSLATGGSSGVSTPRGDTAAIGNLGDYLVRLYCRLEGQELGEFESVHGSPNFSTKFMIVYGLIKGFLRCKTMFPVLLDSSTTLIPVLRSCDGCTSWDAIGVRFGLSRSELDETFTHYNVVRIWK
jgi:hypothetical protein